MKTDNMFMKIKKIVKTHTLMPLFLAIGIFLSVFVLTEIEAKADNTVVTGTVSRGTTADTLCLYNISNGRYTIKINGNTNNSTCKVLTVGKTVTVSMYKGSDGNFYAASIAPGTKAAPVNTTTSYRTTVSGTVTEATRENMLYLNTSGGVMQFRMDSSTDLSSCRILVTGVQVTVAYTRGSDAINKALSISSGNVNVSQTTPVSTTNNTSIPANTIGVTGTPTGDSTDGVLNLKAKDGTYYIVIDSTTDTSGGIVFTTSNTLTAYIYRGNDAKMHAAKIVGARSGNVSLNSGTANFEGIVENVSTEEILSLKTSGGTMKIKLDGTTALTGAKGIINGQKITVNASTGADSYWHARTISATSTAVVTNTPNAGTPVNGTIAVTGTPTKDCKNGELYLKAKDGTYYIVVDNGAASGGFIFTESNTLTAHIYRGKDNKMHAAKIVGTRSSGATLNSGTVAFEGTIGNNSKEDLIYLSTSGGLMEIKLDAGTSLSNALNLCNGQRVVVNGAVGSDSYWHAVSIVAK